MNKEYIYIRNHESYNKYNAYKLGKTNNIIESDAMYIKNEIEPGTFICIIELINNRSSIVEKLLENYFKSKNLHVYLNSSTKFFKKDIIELIELYLIDMKIKYKIITDDDLQILNK